MNKTFVKTKNVKAFVSLATKLKNTPNNAPKMGLIFGEPGLGKTQSIGWWALRNKVTIITATNHMKTGWFLRKLVQELDEIPQKIISDLFEQAANKLIESPRMLIVDEIDYLVDHSRTIETIRDLHDRTGVPVLLVGMGAVDKKLCRYKHLFDRIAGIYEFKPFDIDDVRLLISELSEIPFEEDAIEWVHKRANRLRQIVNIINNVEDLAKTNEYKSITKYILESEYEQR